MSHYVDYLTVEKESKIIPTAKAFASQHCNRYENPSGKYHGDLTIYKYQIFDSVELADQYIYDHYDNHDYHDCAVKFRDLDAVKPTKKMLDIERRIKENDQARKEYILANTIQNRVSKSITCPCCGSRLNLSYVHDQTCPLCHTDLRSTTVQNRIKKFGTDKKKLEKELSNAKKKLADKAPIKWRVKLEVHC